MSEMDCGYRHYNGGGTPHGLVRWYLHLPVRLHDNSVTQVSIHYYRNLNITEAENAEHSAEAGWREGRSQVFGAVRRRAQRIAGTRHGYRAEYRDASNALLGTEEVNLGELAKVFSGQGDPLQIAQVLRLGVWSGAIPGNDSLQTFCDRYIGLDCAGFAGVYYGGRWRGVAPSRYHAARPIASLDDVRLGHAIVWHQESGGIGHVAVIDEVSAGSSPPPRTELRCFVAESCGSQRGPEFPPHGGLSYSEYRLTMEGRRLVVHLPTRQHQRGESGNFNRSNIAVIREVP